jgi:DNA-binding NarL/FixJ family response regulator
MDNKIKIMIIDDHAVVRLGLTSLIEKNSNYEVVCDAGSGAEAYKKIEKYQPDLILLDYKLPDGDGVTICHQIKRAYPEIKIIIVSAYCDEYMIKDALQAGAEGYLMKTIDKYAIMNAIENVLKGEKSVDPSLLTSLVDAVKGETKQYDLTTNERELLDLLAKGLKNKEISKELFISEKTVRNYLTRVFDKIHVSNRTEAAIFWIENRH